VCDCFEVFLSIVDDDLCECALVSEKVVVVFVGWGVCMVIVWVLKFVNVVLE